MEKKQLSEEILQGKPKEAENLKEDMMPTPKKIFFGIKAIEDDESSCGSTEEMNLGTILIGIILISSNCYTISLTLLDFFKLKEMEEA